MCLQVRICEFKKRSKRNKNLVEQKQTLLPLRSGSEETVDTVVAVSSTKKQQHTEAEQR